MQPSRAAASNPPPSSTAAKRKPISTPSYPIAAAAPKPTSKAKAPSSVTTRARERRRAEESDESGGKDGGWEEELERAKAGERKRPTSPSPPSSQPSPSSAASLSSHSFTPSLPSLSSSSSSSSPASPPLSPVSWTPPLTRPHSASGAYRSSFGRPHGPAASVLTQATTSFASELSHLEDHPAFQSLTSTLASLPFLGPASARLGISELTLATLLCLSATLAFVVGVGVMGAVDLLLFLYPAYLSYHALESDMDEGGEEVGLVGEEEEGVEEGASESVRHWLLYWTVYGLLSLVWWVTDWVWGERSSVYWMLRTAVGVALVVERWRVCEAVWDWLVWPVWRVNERTVDTAVDRVIDEVGKVWEDCKALMKEAVVWWLRGGGGSRPPPSTSVLSRANRRRVK